MRNGRIFQKALIFSVRACYLFLKGVVIALYKFLEEEQPYPPANTVSLTSTESGVILGDGLKLVDMLEKGDTETVRGKGPVIDISNTRGDESLGKVAALVQAESALDWAVSVGILRVEADPPMIGNVHGADYTRETDKVLAVDECSGGLFDRGVTTDVQIYTTGFTVSALSVQTPDPAKT